MRILVSAFPSSTRAGMISTEARTLRNGRRPQTRGLERELQAIALPNPALVDLARL